ncbi:MAG: permease [Anaerolineales bacterium]
MTQTNSDNRPVATTGRAKGVHIDFATGLLIGLALALVVIAYRRGGFALALDGFAAGGRVLLSVTPLLLAAFLLAGLIQVLITRERVTRWLGTEAGWRGIALACIGGALIPGGPYVYYPIAAVLLHSGASLGVLVAFVSAKNLWSVSRLPLEFALLGPQLTLIRFGLTLAAPPLLGLLAEALFGRYMKRICEGARP